jgi:hypothetical protein
LSLSFRPPWPRRLEQRRPAAFSDAAGTVVLITVGNQIAAAGTAIDGWLATNVTAKF